MWGGDTPHGVRVPVDSPPPPGLAAARRLYVFDVDGTLIRGFMEGLPYDHVELLPGRLERLRDLASEGAEFAVATNQAGCGFGHQTVEQIRAKMGRVLAEVEWFCGRPFSVHICHHHPHSKAEEWRGTEAQLRRRKPGPGMLEDAMRAHRVLPSQTTFVGDMETDRGAAEAAGVRYSDEAEFFGAGRLG